MWGSWQDSLPWFIDLSRSFLVCITPWSTGSFLFIGLRWPSGMGSSRCPWPRGQKIGALALALASTPCPLESGLHSPVTCSLSIITAVAWCFVIDRFMCNVEPCNLAFQCCSILELGSQNPPNRYFYFHIVISLIVLIQKLCNVNFHGIKNTTFAFSSRSSTL